MAYWAENRTSRLPGIVASAILAAFAWLGIEAAQATDPSRHCKLHDLLVNDLTGHPHYERRVFVLRDKIPDVGHRFELFMNKGEGGRHSYTILRTRKNTRLTCILTAGLVGETRTDEKGRERVTLFDENHPDIFTLVMKNASYELIRSSKEDWISEMLLKVHGTKTPVVSHGQVMEDYREAGFQSR